MVKIEPRIYLKFVTIENRWTVLYVKLNKLLCVSLKSALIFY